MCGVSRMVATAFLFTACSSATWHGYHVASPSVLPKMPRGLRLQVLPYDEQRDCEGQWCTLYALVTGEAATDGNVLRALEAAFKRKGWTEPQPQRATGTLECRPGYSVAIDTKGDPLLVALSKESKYEPLTAVLELLPRSC